jgi:hypothetical protein
VLFVVFPGKTCKLLRYRTALPTAAAAGALLLPLLLHKKKKNQKTAHWRRSLSQ